MTGTVLRLDPVISRSLESTRSNVTFTVSTDADEVWAIMAHPSIYPHMGSDDRPPVEKFRPYFGDRIKHVIVRDNEETIGMFLLILHTNVKWESHTLMLPNGRGRRAVKAYREGIEWCKANGCAYLFGIIPEDNIGALEMAILGGMEPIGTFKKSVLRSGIMRDECIVGRTL
jgi:hypothetical protein